MDVRAHEIERIPSGNLRVRRALFVEVWREAERLAGFDEYAIGVAFACRWMAGATVMFNGRPSPAQAPATRTRRRAHEELLELEFLEASQQAMRFANSDDPDKPFIDGAVATLSWAWKGQGNPPLHLDRAEAG